MCCCNVAGVVGNCFKTCIVFLCIFLISGIALIIAGGVLLGQDNGLRKFKQAVKDFDPTPINEWVGNINGAPTTVRRLPLNVDGVNDAASVFAEAVISAPNSYFKSNSLSVSVNVNGISTFTRSYYWPYSDNPRYECTSSDCDLPGKKCTCRTKYSEFERNCEAWGGYIRHDSDTCTKGKRCGRCNYSLYPSTIYMVLFKALDGTYARDTVRQSAKYNFSETANDNQNTMPGTVVVRLYSEKDPFIALQELTKGTNDFGIKNKHTTGTILIVIGCILFVLGIVVGSLLICYCIQRRDKHVTVTPPPTSSSSSPPNVTNTTGNVPPYNYGQLYPELQQHNYIYGQQQQQELLPPQQDYIYGQPLQAPPGYIYGQPLQPQDPYPYTHGQYSLRERNVIYAQPPPQYGYGQTSSPPKGSKDDSDLAKK